ncbi:MAG: CBS domain-containing protein [Proteobacteria bacterium]|nr:CBS domain-containing protein [Pseudomonadota bacterium]MBI3498479.1 CBS domain-containing protein [Pseudomonadota bacterium]
MIRKIIPDVVHDQDLVQLTPDQSVREAARQMAARRVGAALVCEGGRLVGIFTERDLLNRVVARDLDPNKTKLAEVMTRDPATVAPDQRSVDALHLMHEGGFRHLPVVERGRVRGIVSLRDFMTGEIEAMQAEREEQEALLVRR